jgi:hypothetical protein
MELFFLKEKFGYLICGFCARKKPTPGPSQEGSLEELKMRKIPLPTKSRFTCLRRERDRQAFHTSRFTFYVSLFLTMLFLITEEKVTWSESIEPKSLPAVKTSQPPEIDGNLDDPCWQNAPKATEFVDKLLDTPPKDQTVAYILYDDENIYVAFYCYDSKPEEIIAHETKRDGNFWNDDYASFSINPFCSHRYSDRSFFLVNAIGTQFSQIAGGRTTKTEWKGDWKAAVKRAEDGWTAEMKVPFAILNYPSTEKPVAIEINFDRKQQRTGVNSFWSNIGPQEHLEKDGRLVGLIFPKQNSNRHLSLMAYTFAGVEPEQSQNIEAGVDVKYPLTSGVTSIMTVNPDFSNVEQDVESIDFSYQQRWYPDRRPFFQEGSDIFSDGESDVLFFYSRNIPQFDIGAKAHGKIGKTAFGILNCADFGERNDMALALKQDIGASSGIRTRLIRRDDSEAQNQVITIEPGGRLNNVGFGGILSKSWTEGEGGEGSVGAIYFGRSTKRTWANVNFFYLPPGFNAADGFVPYDDMQGYSINGGYNNEWRESSIRKANCGFNVFHADHCDGKPYQSGTNFWGGIQFSNDYGIRLNTNFGRYEEHKDWTAGLTLQGNVRDQYRGYGVNFSYGRRQSADYRYVKPYINLKPADKISLSLSSEFLWHKENRIQHILQLNYDITPERGLGGRLVYRDGKLNAFLTYRQAVRKGMDAFIIVGDPNADKMQKRFVAKLVMPLR